MNGLMKVVARLSLRSVSNPLKLSVTVGDSFLTTGKVQFSRTLWHLCSRNATEDAPVSAWRLKNPSHLCSCGCGVHRIHTKGERELIEFLSEEIANEQKVQKTKSIPKEIDSFQVKYDGSEVELVKQAGDEIIEISFNVNHTVDADEDQEAEVNPNMDKPDFADLKSKPNFEVDVKRGSKILSFTCSFTPNVPDEQSEGGYRDVFGIDEVTIYEGKWSDKGYLVAGDVLDGYLYDLLMNYLDEKGISNEFADKLCDLSTGYEHKLYVTFLEDLQKFSAGK